MPVVSFSMYTYVCARPLLLESKRNTCVLTRSSNIYHLQLYLHVLLYLFIYSYQLLQCPKTLPGRRRPLIVQL